MTMTMTMRSKVALVVVVAGWIGVGTEGDARAELITNGSFESPPLSDGELLDIGAGSTVLTGWAVLGRDVLDLQTNYSETVNGISRFNSEDGSSAIDLTGAGNTGPTDGVMQMVATDPGTTYTLSFYVGRATGGGNYSTAATIGLSIDGASQVTYTNNNTTPGMINWEQFTTTFVATGPSTAIAFYNDTPLQTAYAGLDNVSLNPPSVPEPSSLVATGSTLLIAAGFVRLRRRSVRTPRSLRAVA